MKLVDHRPATALTSRDDLVAGMEVWSTHFRDAEPTRLVLASGPMRFEELGARDRVGPSLLDGTWWFKCHYGDRPNDPPHEDSCADRSLDGSDYNGNYLFRTEADAREWLAATYPLYDA
jgi:hypothetical protein